MATSMSTEPVITSYSIHYTKLYDFLFPVLRNFLPLALLPFLPGILADARRVALTEYLIITFGTLIALFIA